MITFARRVAETIIGIVICAATITALAESYRSLYDWAAHHGLPPLWAAVWPLMIDSFLVVGELTLFVLILTRARWTARLPAWIVSVVGLSASVAGNVGHFRHAGMFTRGTAAIPPLAATAGLAVGLGLLKRRIAHPAPAAARQRPYRVRATVARVRHRATVAHRRFTERATRHLGPRQLHAWLTPHRATIAAHIVVQAAPPVAAPAAPEPVWPTLPRHAMLAIPDVPPSPHAPAQPRQRAASNQPTAYQMREAILASLRDPTLSARAIALNYLDGNRRAAGQAVAQATNLRSTGGTPSVHPMNGQAPAARP